MSSFLQEQYSSPQPRHSYHTVRTVHEPTHTSQTGIIPC